MSSKVSKNKKTDFVKPPLSSTYRQYLAEADYDVNVEISLKTNYRDTDNRRVACFVEGSIYVDFFHPETEESDSIKVGYINGWRTISIDPMELWYWADLVGQDILTAFEWFVNHQKKFDPEDVLLHPALFIDSVMVEPEWRGNGLALPAVATYLDLIDPEFVFLIPFPLNNSELSRRECKLKQKLLKRYWQKLGFENYDARHNILWTYAWDCPNWLRG